MNLNKIPAFDGKVMVVGDVMLDRYWMGTCQRVSPEAPVPVVKFSSSQDRAGGAANVAINISALGAPCHLLGITGEDQDAMKLQMLVRQNKIEPDLLLHRGLPTITKHRILGRGQQMLRVDFEESFQDIPKDPLVQVFENSLQDCKIVVASDYGKGTLSCIGEMITLAAQRGIPILIDPKGTDFERYCGAYMLTPNMSEFEAVVGKVRDNDELDQKAKDLIYRCKLKCLLITRSEKGMSLVRPGFRTLHLPAQAREVYDVTGAGDTVIAVLAASMASGVDVVSACELANTAAGIVVGKMGTSSVSVDEIRRALNRQANVADAPYKPAHRGIITEEELLKVRKKLKEQGLRVVMTNGCFDLLHRGHISYLKQAKALGDVLIVAVNTDRSVHALKGAGRPIVSLSGRMEVLAGLESVDYVVSFDEDNPRRLISQLLPDILTKGGDYTPEEVAGYDEVTQNGGKVIILPYVPGASTTAMVSKIMVQRGAEA